MGGRIGKYEVVAELSEGAFGTVYEVRHNGYYVIKQMKGLYLHEVELLSKISHENILKYEEPFIENYNLFIVMEFAAKGILPDHLDTITSSEKKCLEISWAHGICFGIPPQ